MRKDIFRKGMIFGIIFLFVGAGFLSNTSGSINEINRINYIAEVTTSKILLNSPPVCSNEIPTDGAIGVSIKINKLAVKIFDLEGDSFDWKIQTSPFIGSDSGFGESNDTMYCGISGLKYSTTYHWYVNVTDPFGSDTWTRRVYSFTTEEEPQEEDIPTVAEIVIAVTKRISGNVIMVGIQHNYEEITSWTELDNTVRVKWEVLNPEGLDYKHSPFTVRVRIREHQENSLFPSIEFFKESGRIGTPDGAGGTYKWIYVDIPITKVSGPGEETIDVRLTELDEMKMVTMILYFDPSAQPIFQSRTSANDIIPPHIV